MLIIVQSDITCDLSHQAAGSCEVPFIMKLPDPNVKYVRLIPTVIIVELETLDVTLPGWHHPLGLQPGGVSLRTFCCASMHEVTYSLIWNVVVQN